MVFGSKKYNAIIFAQWIFLIDINYFSIAMTFIINIQVYSRASDQESCGWWRAIVKMIKVEILLICYFLLIHYTTPFQGDFHVVEYLGWETTYTEIVPSDR